jgi:hypothetical protein
MRPLSIEFNALSLRHAALVLGLHRRIHVFGGAVPLLAATLFSGTACVAGSGGDDGALHESADPTGEALQPLASPEEPLSWAEATGPLDISVQHGMLVFSSAEAFEASTRYLQSLSGAEADAWERRLGFVSQRNIFDRIVQAEYAHFVAPYEKLSREALSRTSPPVGHSATYAQYLERGVIREIPDPSGDTYDYNLPSPALACVLNEEGFFAIGETVYQMKGAYVKEMQDGSFTRLKDLAAATKTDTDAAISVQASPVAMAGGVGSFDKSTGWVTAGKRRGSLRVIFNTSYLAPSVTTQYDVNVQSQVKNFWGNWLYAPCPNEVWISGSWTANFDFVSLASQSFVGRDSYPRSFSYPQTDCINNFWASISPDTGDGIGYHMVTTYTPVQPDLGIQSVSLSPMAWSASVPGGSSGIALSVNHCEAMASMKLNGQSGDTHSICQGAPLALDGAASTCAATYFVSVLKSDASWGAAGQEYGRWLSAADFASFGGIESFDVKAFYASYGQTFAAGQYYRVKLAVSGPWSETVKLVHVEPATPSLAIGGTPPPQDGSPIEVCADSVTVDASATSCESTYAIVVEESDRWWNRTYDYEWGRWFSGQAPSSLDLQQLSASYSYPPNFTGSPGRQGSPLVGGDLPAGGARHYRVGVCTAEPSWACKWALVRVNDCVPPPQF